MKKRFFFLVGLSILLVLVIGGLWLISKTSAQSQTQKNDIPDYIRYEQLFRIAQHHSRKALAEERRGNLKHAEMLNSYFQRKIQLNNQSKEVLEDVADSFFRKADALKKLADDERKAIQSNSVSKESGEAKISKLREERRVIPIEYWELLREKLNPEDLTKIHSFITNQIVPRLIYKAHIKDSAASFIGYSEVDYDYDEAVVSGYAYTDTANLLIGCDPEKSECYVAHLQTDLTGSIQGWIDGDDLENCNFVEKDFFISGIQPGEEFCVTSQHDVARVGGWYPYCSAQGYDFGDVTDDCIVTQARNVTGVDFQLIAQNNLPIDENPPVNPGGGLRIFPDDNTPMENQNRQTIRVRASINKPVAGVTVYFRNFDLDDPSDDMTIDSNGTTENDNNGEVGGSSAGQLSSTSATTNAQGIATVNFTVTMQPGDNFAIAASSNQNQLNSVSVNGTALVIGGTTIETACDGTEVVCRSEMLTVWRRFHIEVDSMKESDQNWVLGNFATGVVKLRRLQQATLNVNTTNPLEENRFENGRVTFSTGNLRVVNNTADSITVENTGFTNVTVYVGDIFQLFDDDDFNNNDGVNLDGDTGEDIPETNMMSLFTASSDDSSTNVFAPAYVRPVYVITADTSDNSFFQSNAFGDSAEDTRALFLDKDLGNTDTDVEFWSVYVLAAYQHTLIEDNDPVTEPATFGIVDAITSVSGEGSGTLIFRELHRSVEQTGAYTYGIEVTTAHEISHLFSCEHGDGGLMGDNFGGLPVSNQLSPTMISKIRSLTHP